MDTDYNNGLLTNQIINEDTFRALPRDVQKKLEDIYTKSTQHSLPSRSRYQGVWLDSLQCMDGHGVYTFPDDSVYKGYFQRGHFHGYGTLHLAAPYNITFKGTFIRGELSDIDEMWFDDGLGIEAAIDGLKIDLSNWKYCTNSDRRYAIEQREGIQPVGPFSLLAPELEPRMLPKNSYDVGEGVFSTVTGIITQRPLPFPSCHFVTCKKDEEWIINNCRLESPGKLKLSPEICHNIIRNNLNSETEIAEHVPTCNHDQEKNRRRYFCKLCPEYGKIPKDSDDSLGSHLSIDTASWKSFSESSLSVDIEELLFMAHEYDQYKFGRDLTQESSVTMRSKK